MKPTGYCQGKPALGSARFLPYDRPLYYIM